MPAASPAIQRRASFWLLMIGTTIFLSIEPALFLVVLAVGLSALAVWWILLMARMLLLDALGGTQRSAGDAVPKSSDAVS